MASEILARVEIVRGDIVRQQVDCIVNAANNSLLGGGGVDGAIHRAAGPRLLEECRTLGGCPTGEARITPGYRLPASFVIHAVGPVYSDGTRGESELLASAYRCCLSLASQHKCSSIAFPSISTGAFSYPIEQAAGIAQSTVLNWLRDNALPERVVFVLFSENDLSVYQSTLHRLAAELG